MTSVAAAEQPINDAAHINGSIADSDSKQSKAEQRSQSPKNKAARAKATISIQEFHRMVNTSSEDDVLPEGPSADATNADGHSRKWVAEWADGEVMEALQPLNSTGCTLEDFKRKLDICLNEFLTNFDLTEAVRCIAELQAPQYHEHIVKRGVLRAMDRTDRERELVAVLLSSLHVRQILSSEQIADGFLVLAQSLDDILIDTPDACSLIAHFLADAVLDGLLSRASIRAWPSELTSSAPVARLLHAVEGRLVGRHPVGGDAAEGKRWREELRGVVAEYLSSHDADEVRRRLVELAVPLDMYHEIVRAAIELALDRRDLERELVCQLLSNLLGDPLLPLDIVRGFEALLARIDDLTIDLPSAPAHLAAFLVRAAADDLIAPAFVRTLPPDALQSEQQRSTLTQARALLAASHFGDRRRNVFGRSTDVSIETLKQNITDMIREYFTSADAAEALRCVRELDAAPFHHELVKRMLVLSLDGPEREQQLAYTLTAALRSEELLSAEQLALGCQRAVDAEPDLRLDNPRSAAILATYIERCCAEDLLPDVDTWARTAAALGGA